MITEDYVSFETAKLLKEKGFDAPCYTYWHEYENRLIFSQSVCAIRNISNPCFFGPAAPTLQMAMKWLREKRLVICITPLSFYCGEKVSNWGYNIWADDNLEVDEDTMSGFNTYEEACEEAIKYCLENLI